MPDLWRSDAWPARAQAKAEVFRRIREAAGVLLADRGSRIRSPLGEVAIAGGHRRGDVLFRYVASKEELLTLVYGDRWMC